MAAGGRPNRNRRRRPELWQTFDPNDFKRGFGRLETLDLKMCARALKEREAELRKNGDKGTAKIWRLQRRVINQLLEERRQTSAD